MSKIVLLPSGVLGVKDNYEQMSQERVSLERIRKFISASEAKLLADLYPDSLVSPWGVTAGKGSINRTKWEKLEPGDIILFAGGNRIYSTAEVVFKIHNEQLARNLWAGKVAKDGAPFEYILFYRGVREVDISYEVLGKAAGYKPGYLVRSFNVLSDSLSQTIVEALNLSHISEKEFALAVKELELLSPGGIDTERMVRLRTEQGFLRRHLFSTRERATCSVCRRDFPVELLVASHIKRRAECTLEEKLSYKANVIPMCILGCDALFERGYISVSDGYIVIHSEKKLAATPAVHDYLVRLEGVVCSAWNEMRKPFFEWHLADHAN